MPANLVRLRSVPVWLRFQNVKDGSKREEDTAEEVGEVVGALDGGRAEVLEDAGEGEDTADVEDCGADGHCEGGEETDFVDVVGSDVVPGGPPLPLSLGEDIIIVIIITGGGGGGFLFDALGAAGVGICEGSLVVVGALGGDRWSFVAVGGHVVVGSSMLVVSPRELEPIHEQLLHSTAKLGLRAIIVRLEEEENGAELEKSGADKGGDATVVLCLTRELGLGKGNGEPVEEAAGDEDDAADGEGDADEPGYVPVGEEGEHAGDAEEDFVWVAAVLHLDC